MPHSFTLRIADLSQRKPTAFDMTADADMLADLTKRLELLDLRKVRLQGQIAPQGRDDWALTAHLGATVVQPCIVTLAPVTTRIEEDIRRLYLAHMADQPDASEVEMPEDDTVEPLPATINLRDVLAEALALALPLYPRADGAALDAAVFTEPGKAPMTDDEARPFAGLASLRDKLAKDGD
ncbi:YceD family protein [Pseudaestuariivita rosea]|uniref:YceD family protein n=1 Tax=Pseudaestuariivita rosea TaxID=2763263 RepID=UPI001ABA2AD1|nr:YceD family protein [Pseudaestuariivita rosea]